MPKFIPNDRNSCAWISDLLPKFKWKWKSDDPLQNRDNTSDSSDEVEELLVRYEDEEEDR